MIAEFKSGLGKLELHEDRVVIKRGYLSGGGKTDKVIPLSSITDIQVKKPGLSAGYIRFITSGTEFFSFDDLRKNHQIDNAVHFNGRARYEEALALKRRIEELMLRPQQAPEEEEPVAAEPASPAAFSVADELYKLKDLLDRGVITEEEFLRLKARLIN